MNLAKIAHNPEPSLTDPQPTTLAVKVYEHLHRSIRSDSLAPGQPLRTGWLTAHYQTGVSPSREALARLAAEYFVTAEGKRGYRVSEISSKIVRKIETEHQQLMGFTIERNTEKASALLDAHRWRTYSAIKKQFLSDSRTTESCI
jgi:DNA-binding FadR family transcriptional regulator